MKNSLNNCGFPASRTRSGGDKITVAPVFWNMGMQKPSLQEKERATATAKRISSATATFFYIYGELVLKRRGLRGLLRLAFA